MELVQMEMPEAVIEEWQLCQQHVDRVFETDACCVPDNEYWDIKFAHEVEQLQLPGTHDWFACHHEAFIVRLQQAQGTMEAFLCQP